MNCHSSRHLEDLYEEGRLPAWQARAVAAHRASCKTCGAARAPKLPAVSASDALLKRLSASLSSGPIAVAPRKFSFSLKSLEPSDAALAALAVMLPLASSSRTYDAAAPKYFILETAALLIGLFWTLRGLSRGRWQLPYASFPALIAAKILGFFLVVGIALDPTALGDLPKVLPIFACDLLFLGALLDSGGRRVAGLLTALFALSIPALFFVRGAEPFNYPAGIFLAAAAIFSLRTALGLRKKGLLPEAAYAAGAAAITLAIVVLSAFKRTNLSEPATWMIWPMLGVACGFAPLAFPRRPIAALPVPAGPAARKFLQIPAFVVFAALAVWPGTWLKSDVRFNDALAAYRDGRMDDADQALQKVAPGAAHYADALYLDGQARLAQNDPAGALNVWSRLAHVEPDIDRVHALAADAFARLGRYSDAEFEMARQSTLGPLTIGELAAWSQDAFNAGDAATAQNLMKRAQLAARNPGDAAALKKLSRNIASKPKPRAKNRAN